MRSSHGAHGRPLAQRIGAILWPSFLMAALASMVLFSFVDPLDLHAISFPDWDIGRAGGYTVGFFMFWLITAGSSYTTWLLLRSFERLNADQPDNRPASAHKADQ